MASDPTDPEIEMTHREQKSARRTPLHLPPTVPGDRVNIKNQGEKPGPKLPSRVGTPAL